MIHDFDGFDSYRTANISQKWTNALVLVGGPDDPNAAGCSIVLGQGRCGTNCGRTQAGPGGPGMGFTKGLPISGPTFQFGAAFNIQQLGAGNNNLIVLYKGNTPVVRVNVDASGSFTWVYNPDSAFPPVGWVSNGGLYRVNEWHQVSMGGTLAPDGTGSVTIKIGGIFIQTILAQNAWDAFESGFNAIEFGGSGFSNRILWDDVFVGDLTGAVNNTLLGDVHVQKMTLQSDGAIITFAPVGTGADHADRVEDNDLPDLANGIQSSAVGATDVYNVENLADVPGQELFAVKMSSLAIKDNPGDRALDAVVYDGSPHPAGKNKPITNTGYTYVEQVMETDPATGAIWTPAGFNARQIGPKLAV